MARQAVGCWGAAFLVVDFTLRGADALLAVAGGQKDKAKLLLAACWCARNAMGVSGTGSGSNLVTCRDPNPPRHRNNGK